MDRCYLLMIYFTYADSPALRAYKHKKDAISDAQLFIGIDNVRFISCYLVDSKSYDFQFHFEHTPVGFDVSCDSDDCEEVEDVSF